RQHLLFKGSRDHPHLHSFPTRRSSDLEALGAEIVQLEGAAERLRAKLDEGAAKLGERGQEIEEISRSSSAELAKTADILLQSTTDLSIASDEGVTRLTALRNTLANSMAEVERALDQLASREGGLLQMAREAETGARTSAEQVQQSTQQLSLRASEMTEQMLLSSRKLKDETLSLDTILTAASESLNAVDQKLREG